MSGKNNKLLTVLKYIFSFGLGVVLLWLAMRGVDFQEVKAGFREANYLWVVLGLAVAVLSHWLRAARWVMLFRAAGYESNTMNLFASVMVGNMVNQALPRAGEISRATVTARSEKIPLSVTFGTMVTDRIFDIIILGFFVVAVFLLQFKEIVAIMDNAFSQGQGGSQAMGMPLWQVLIIVTLVVGAVVFFVFRRRILSANLRTRIRTFVRETWGAILSVRKMDQPLLFIAYSLGIWACYVLMTYLVFFSLDATADLSFIFAFTAFTMGAIGMVFPSPGGIGSYHFAIIMSFVAYSQSFGWDKEAARIVGTNLAFIIHTSQMIMMIVVGFLCYLYLMRQVRLSPKVGMPHV